MSSQQSLKRLASKISPAHQSFKRLASKLSPSGPQHTQLLKELFPGAIIAPSIQNRQIMDKLTLIDTYLSLGKLDQAEMIFHQTWRRSPLRVKDLINPGLINKFIRELLLQGKLAKALYWFNNMSSYHVSPNIHTFAILISYYLSSSQIAQAQELIDSIKDKFNLTDLLVTPEFLEDPQLTQSLEALLEAPNEQSLLQSALLQEFKHPDNKNSDYKITQLRLPNSPMVAFLDAALNAFKDTSAIEAYHRQMLLEQHCFVANMKVENLKESRLPDALKTAVSNFPTHMIRNWQASIAAATKNYIETLTEKNPKEPVLQFLSLFTPEKLAAVTISRFLHVPNRPGKDGTNALSTKTYALSGKIALSIGGALELENNLKEMSRQKNRKMFNITEKIHQLQNSGKLRNLALRNIVANYAQNLQTANWNPRWSDSQKIEIGSIMAELFCKNAMITSKALRGDAFTETLDTPAVSFVRLNLANSPNKPAAFLYSPELKEILQYGNNISNIGASAWDLPMVIKPLPWLTWNSGGFLQRRTEIARVKSKEHASQLIAADKQRNLLQCQRALDALGQTAWIINVKLFNIVAEFWNSNIFVKGLPCEIQVPPIPEPIDPKDKKAWRVMETERKRKIAEAYSIRSDISYKLSIARAFIGETIYFPHNMDFRGRAYPIPPHFNHISGDLCRGLLKFERKKRLGKAGFDWLKIHIANLAGVDKVSLEERREFVAKNLQNILSSAREPMQYEWWRNHDYPFQLLAACIEFSEAYSIPDPTEYESNLPIHQDGSCNGLQHYAALGGDIVGARAVNLDVSDKPGDVYKDVSIRVQEYVDRDANEGKTEAILMKSRITRKLVKQTVMTNTYGVTLIGAKEQVFDRLVEAQANESGDILTKSQIIQCSKYISKLIFEAMEDMFQKARLLQNWLTISARVISSSVSSHVVTEQQIEDCEFLESIGALRPVGHSKVNLTSYYEKLFGVSTDSVDQVESEAQLENRKITAAKSEYRVNSVSWTTPIGFPVVQPYDNRPTIRVKTPLQVFNIVETEGKYPVNAKKQSTAFPPNFIHSLDATHMMLSALACHSQGIEFAAVHDSYWTHGCDVNQMGAILREQFVLLHQKDLMKSLESEFYQKYGKMKTPILVELDNHQLEKYKEYLAKTKRKPTRKILVYQNFTLPPLPSKGSFDINSVKHSTYFFH